jgi:hypothetical protein
MHERAMKGKAKPIVQIPCIEHSLISQADKIKSSASEERARTHSHIKVQKHVVNVIMRQLISADNLRLGPDFKPVGINYQSLRTLLKSLHHGPNGARQQRIIGIDHTDDVS